MGLAATSSAFLLAISGLFSIINPVGGALIFHDATSDRTHAERLALANRVGLYSLLVMLGALWAGSYVLNFFGITLGALRIAGGLVVASNAWQRLNAPEQQEARKQRQAEHSGPIEDVAFFPLTMPFTTGPGTISVAISLGAERPARGDGLLWFFLGASAAAAVMAALILLAYRTAEPLMGLLGPSGARIVARMMAFLLLCIGAQIAITGVQELVLPMLAGRS
ncbi:MAG: NAAT family transporter [Acidisphaera sp.]|nr:NAAT family transporter [Acidisphaera sp.]